MFIQGPANNALRLYDGISRQTDIELHVLDGSSRGPSPSWFSVQLVIQHILFWILILFVTINSPAIILHGG
jgi:hypothetical protein